MRIIELNTATEFGKIYPLLKQVNPSLTKAQFTKRLKAMRAQGYRCIAAVENGKYLGISGFWTGTRFWCGKFIDYDNVIVDKSLRSTGIGRKLVAWIEKEARRLGCDMLGLDCYTTSHDAHRFYFREGFIIKGYHFTKSL